MKLYIYILLCFFSAALQAQEIAPQLPKWLGVDTLIRPEMLDSFYQKLSVKEGKVNIVHIGDSHIQGDFLTNHIRSLLGRQFGYGGPGLLFPYKSARTNGGLICQSMTNARWEVNKVILPYCPNSNGLAGISVSHPAANAWTAFQLKPGPDSMDQSVSKITLIHGHTDSSYVFKLTDFDHNKSYMPVAAPDAYTSVFECDEPFMKFGIAPEDSNAFGKQQIIYGVLAENDVPGIIYHHIGVNGAEYRHYNCNPLFFRQLQVLHPDIFIVSMGTNEAQDWKRSNDELSLQFNAFLDSLTAQNPGVPILITTPMESWRRGRHLNKDVKRVRDVLLVVAAQRGLTCWDLYQIAGGYGSSFRWRKHLLFSRDMVHHSPAGYRLQAELLYESLMDGYQKYNLRHQ